MIAAIAVGRHRPQQLLAEVDVDQLANLDEADGGAGVAEAGYDISDLNSLAPEGGLFGSDIVDTGWGIYVALISSISLLLASIALWVRTKGRAVALEVSEEAPSPGRSDPVG